MISNEEARILGFGDAEAIMAIRRRLGTQPGGPNRYDDRQAQLRRTVHDALRDEAARMIAALRLALTPEERTALNQNLRALILVEEQIAFRPQDAKNDR